jgi:acylphosphatase
MSSPDNLRTMRYQVIGRVQGVGFRAYSVRLARQAGVVGWVRNDPDGSVRAEATGTEPALLAFGAGLRMGPPGARVERMEAIALDEAKPFPRSDFAVEE